MSLNLNAQSEQGEEDFETDWVQPIKIFKKVIPIYLVGSGGISYGPEHIAGLPVFNFAIQSHYKKGIYLGVQGGTIIGFTGSHGFHTGIGYKWLTVDYSQTRFTSEKRKYFSHNLKAGINISYVWIKFGPSIINNDYSFIDKDFIHNNKYQFNIEILVSNRMSNE
jgi:hypothetical protein